MFSEYGSVILHVYSIHFDGPDVDQQKIGQLVAGDRDSECDPNGATDLRFNNLNGERVVVETISEGTPLGGHGRASETTLDPLKKFYAALRVRHS